MDTLAVAGYIAAHVGDVTHEERLRLQKMLYYADGWSLAWTGRRLLDEDFEAWREGPVLRKVYVGGLKRVSVLPGPQQAIVDAVLRYYDSVSARELSELTHAEEPWVEARDGMPSEAASDRPISASTMRRYFVAQSLAGTPGPRRPKDLDEAPEPGAVADVATRADRRWSEALDELADR